MGYTEYLQTIYKHLSIFNTPRILEIGIECGNVTIPLLTSLLNNPDVDVSGFQYYGIDIDIRDNIHKFAKTHSTRKHTINLIEQSSLVEMPKIVESKKVFDLILIDGDHNYHTVSNELKHVNSLMHDDSVLIIDDYHGPWALSDYWYGVESTSPQVNNPLATSKKDTDRHGIKPAIHEWLYQNKEMEIYSLAAGLLYKHDNNLLLENEALNYCHGVLIKKGES